jgi:hypothetical protein
MSSDTVLDTVSVKATPTRSPKPAEQRSFGTPFNSVGTVTDWAVGGNGNVGATGESATAGSHCASFSAGTDADGNTISQTIPTVPGKEYTLDFDAGVYGAANGPQLQLNVTVNGNATLLNSTVMPPVAHTFDGNLVLFAHYHFTFTADNSLTMWCSQ